MVFPAVNMIAGTAIAWYDGGVPGALAVVSTFLLGTAFFVPLLGAVGATGTLATCAAGGVMTYLGTTSVFAAIFATTAPGIGSYFSGHLWALLRRLHAASRRPRR